MSYPYNHNNNNNNLQTTLQPPIYVISNPYSNVIAMPNGVGAGGGVPQLVPMNTMVSPYASVPVQYVQGTMPHFVPAQMHTVPYAMVPQQQSTVSNYPPTTTRSNTTTNASVAAAPVHRNIGTWTNFLTCYVLGTFFPIVSHLFIFALHPTIIGRLGGAFSLANVLMGLGLQLWVCGALLNGYLLGGVWWFAPFCMCSFGAYVVALRIWKDYKESIQVCQPEDRPQIPPGMEVGTVSDYALAFLVSCFIPIMGSLLAILAKPRSLRVRYGTTSGLGYCFMMLSFLGLILYSTTLSVTWLLPAYWLGSTIFSFGLVYYPPILISMTLGSVE